MTFFQSDLFHPSTVCVQRCFPINMKKAKSMIPGEEPPDKAVIMILEYPNISITSITPFIKLYAQSYLPIYLILKGTPVIGDVTLRPEALNGVIHLGANIIPLKTWNEVANFVLKIARMISNAPYKDPLSEYMIKPSRPSSDNATESSDTQTWSRMLEQLPGISYNKVNKIVQLFPTMESLYKVYNDPLIMTEEKKELFTHAFGIKTK